MSIYNLGNKSIAQTATVKHLTSACLEDLTIQVALLTAAGAAHNGLGGTLELIFGRARTRQELLAWTAGEADGTYSLVLPSDKTGTLDGAYEYALMFRFAAGAVVTLFQGVLTFANYATGPLDLTPADAEATVPSTVQSVELAATLDLAGTNATLSRGATVYAVLGLPLLFRVTCAQLQAPGGTEYPGATGQVYLSYNGETVGEGALLTQASAGVFEGSIVVTDQLALGAESTSYTGEYIIVITPESTPYAAIRATPITFVASGIPVGAPELSFTALAGSVNRGALAIAGTVTAPTGEVSLSVAVNGSTLSPQPAITRNGDAWSSSVTLTTLGTNTVTVTATGTQGAATASRSTTVVNQAPTVTMAAPSASVNRGALSISGTYTDPDSNSVPTFTFTLNGSAVSPAPSVTAANGAWSSSITLSALGTNTIVVTATDADGGTATATRSTTVVNQAPSITFTAIPASVMQGTLEIAGTASDPDDNTFNPTFSVSVGGVPLSPQPTVAFVGGAWSTSITLSTLGSTTIAVTVTDEDGGTATASRTTTVTELIDYVEIVTTANATQLQPMIEATSGTVSWEVVETAATATGLQPTITLPGNQACHVRMRCSAGLGAITTFNFGFNNSNDAGVVQDQMGAAYNWTAQPVVDFVNLGLMTGLVRFACANNTALTAALDFNEPSGVGCEDLQWVECFGSRVSGVTLPTSTVFRRLCLEANNVTTLDLDPVAASIRDLRAAVQQGGALSFAPTTSDLPSLVHYCTRDQPVGANHIAATRMDGLVEYWAWNTGLTGSVVLPATAVSVQIYNNTITALDVSACTALSTLTAQNNLLSSTQIDNILAHLVAQGNSGGTVDLTNNAAPTATGVAHVATLQGRGWTVNVDVANGSITLPYSESFTEANEYWLDWNTAVHTISGGQLNRTDTGAYRGVYNQFNGSLPADYVMTWNFNSAELAGGFLGWAVQWNPTNNTGVQVFWGNNTPSSNAPICGYGTLAWDLQNGTWSGAQALPATWDDPGIEHQVSIASATVGGTTTYTLYLDGVLYGSFVGLQSSAGRGICWLGTTDTVGGARHMNSVRITATVPSYP